MNKNNVVFERVIHSIMCSSVYRNEVEVFRLERLDNGRGIWGLYPVIDGEKWGMIAEDQYSNDLLSRIESGKYDASLEAARLAAKKVAE